MTGTEYKMAIGLEVHVQIATRTKLFCNCAYRFGATPNSITCPVCLGLPGALPVLNENALALALKAAIACGCELAAQSTFDRKHYFYPDLPKGYQITQFEQPLGQGGHIPLPGGREITLDGIQLEEDAGKNKHTSKGYSLVDFNRCGVPLLEVVSRPDLTSPEEAYDYLFSLKRIMQYIGISECDMEKGTLRCDANISLMPPGTKKLGTKVELKNLNSFRMVQRALAFERKRQHDILVAGGMIKPETRLWDEANEVSRRLRSKEENQDYRFLPEPDLPPLTITENMLARARAGLPELPMLRRWRFCRSFGISAKAAMVLTQDRNLADFFEATNKVCGDAKAAANWIQGEVLRHLNTTETELNKTCLNPENLGNLIRLVNDGVLTGQTAKQVFETLARIGGDPKLIVDEHGLARINDENELEKLVHQAIKENPGPVAQYMNGREKALKALIGPIMRASHGRADPGRTVALLKKIVEELK